MRFEIKPASFVAFALGLGFGVARGADATTPIDYTQRNEPYAAAGTVSPAKQQPAKAAVQDRTVEKVTIEKQKSSLLEKQAAIQVKETRPKKVRENATQHPEAIERTTSDFNQRPAAIGTAADAIKPRMAARYQESLATAQTWPGVRPIDPAAAAKINRFVYRRNPPDPAAPTGDRPVIPAAGGAAAKK